MSASLAHRWQPLKPTSQERDVGHPAPSGARMSILPTAALTVTQLVGGLLASVKTASELAKDTSNHELKAAISDLHNDLLSVKERILELDEENRNLKAQLAHKDELVGPRGPHGYFFYKDGPDQPLCPKCLQSQPPNAVFLSPLQGTNGCYRECLQCHWLHYETPQTNQGEANYNPLTYGLRTAK